MMTILIVDDMLDGRTMLATFLEKNGYQVLGTANGKEALEVLEKQSVDLIITDILMPEMDGYMLCKQIKSDKRWMHIPIIIYSATFTTRQDEIFAIKLGANRFVRKPVDTDSFLNIIRNLIEKGSNGTLDVTQLKFKKEEDVFKLYNERIIHKLEDSESRYKSIFENMTIGLYRTTPDGIILMANPALLKMLGYDSLEEMAKRNLEKEGYHSDYSRAKFKSILDKEGKITDWESAWQRKDGSFIFVLESASAFYDNDGKILYYEGSVEDITARKIAEASLQESQNRLSKAAKMAKLGYWDYDVAENLFTFDDHFYAIFHTTAEEVGGYKLTPEEYAKRFLYPDDQELVAAETRKALETTDPNFSRQLEHRIVYADGGIGWMSINFFIVKDNQGRTIRTFGVNQDITERKRLQEVIVNEQRELKLIIDTSPVLIFYKDKEGRFIRVNNAFAKMLRMDEADFLGKTVFDLYSKEIAQSMTDDDREVLKSNRPKLNIIEQYQSASGPRWVQTDKIPMQDENGNAVGLIGFALDITDLKQAEEVLRKSEKHYRELINGMTETVWIIDYNGDLIDVNQTALEKLGYTKPELLKIGLYGVDSSLKREKIQALAKSMPKDKIQIFETSHKCKDGRSFPVEVYSSLITYHEKPAILSIARDITERKRAEEA
ncbi:MAG: PAS domain S-box protein, partial [Candidatus Neomarinimicrobiota bacterium]